MKRVGLLRLSLVCFLILLRLAAVAQAAQGPAQDDEFNIFLLIMACVFFAGVLGAALVGAAVATLISIAFFTAIGFGLLSASVLVGLYKRSVGAGFKTFLLLLFGGGCAVIGAILSFFANQIFHLEASNLTASILGSAGGLIGGLGLALIFHTAAKYIFRRAMQKMRLM